MSVVSYRIYCDSCENDTVLLDSEMEDSLWSVGSKYQNTGTCPECNPTVSDEDLQRNRESREDDSEPVQYEEIDGIGESTATALRRTGLSTKGDVRVATDAKLEGVKGVGQSKVERIREQVE